MGTLRFDGESDDAFRKRAGPSTGGRPWVMPLQADDPVSPDRILYVYKEKSLYNRRFLQRRRLKELLGKEHRRLVGKAMSMRKRDFLADMTEAEVGAVRQRVRICAGDLWRAVRGKKIFLTLPPRVVQLELHFDAVDGMILEVPDVGQLARSGSASRYLTKAAKNGENVRRKNWRAADLSAARPAPHRESRCYFDFFADFFAAGAFGCDGFWPCFGGWLPFDMRRAPF